MLCHEKMGRFSNNTLQYMPKCTELLPFECLIRDLCKQAAEHLHLKKYPSMHMSLISH